jgi:putative hydrolase of the HAD superfamily
MKPHLKVFRMMIEDSGINPTETLFIDDGECNINTAKECGMSTCLVKNASDWRDELSLMINLNN